MFKKVANFEKYINKRIKAGVRNGRKLFQELEEKGYQGSYATINRYLNQKKDAPVRQYKQSKKVETQPGEQAQVDWGHFKEIETDGKKRKLCAFVYILSYSRMLYVEFTVRQNQRTLQQCHINAFHALGIPQMIRYDNMRTVVSSRIKLDEGNEKFNHPLEFLDFAEFFNFIIELSPRYWPRAKGKVESGIKYVRNNFMQGRRFAKEFKSLEELNIQVKQWTNLVNQRDHQGIGRKPIDLWEKEKQYLRFPQQYPLYNISSFQERKVTKDGYVFHHYNYYSVPFVYALKKVLVKEEIQSGISLLHIYYRENLIASHNIISERHKWVTKEDHLQEKTKNKQKQIHSKTHKSDLSQENFSRPLSYYKKVFENS